MNDKLIQELEALKEKYKNGNRQEMIVAMTAAILAGLLHQRNYNAENEWNELCAMFNQMQLGRLTT